eukprot:3165423-Alexandrium_andersonii.AAC.1
METPGRLPRARDRGGRDELDSFLGGRGLWSLVSLAALRRTLPALGGARPTVAVRALDERVLAPAPGADVLAPIRA